MSVLEEAGNNARSNMSDRFVPKSKIDQVLILLGDEAPLLQSWLVDPENWSSHMICKALDSYAAKTATPGVSCGHTTVERWRTINGVGFDK
tara:strand:+ start:605 stop:877 length:273 start_codon:yes stop_codon:yes gene_type:complete